jgi:5-methylcytosine-specific restriction endonuclease McrA
VLSARVGRILNEFFGQRSMRRIATKRERDLLWILQQGKCAICGNELDSFEVDHVIPFSQQGETSLWNEQALCEICHKSKHRSPSSSNNQEKDKERL